MDIKISLDKLRDKVKDAVKKTEDNAKAVKVTFIVMFIVIAGLIFLLAFMRYKALRIMDISVPYSFSQENGLSYTTMKTFAADKVVSDPSVVIEGVRLTEGSERALLFNLDEKTSVFAQGIYTTSYPASLTKLMTAVLCVKYANFDDVYVMQPDDFDLEEGSQVSGMQVGDSVTINQLFHALVVYSANDAAMAIGRYLDGSVDAFVEHMNREAKDMGLVNTNFTNPSGLHNPENYSCPYDVYILLNEAFKSTEYRDAARLNVYTLRVTTAEGNTRTLVLDSTDKYLTGERTLPPRVTLLGGKTGTTPEAGANLAVYVQNSMGVPFIAVIMNASSRAVLYDDMNQLLSHVND